MVSFLKINHLRSLKRRVEGGWEMGEMDEKWREDDRRMKNGRRRIKVRKRGGSIYFPIVSSNKKYDHLPTQ